jgi:hypothetical protein
MRITARETERSQLHYCYPKSKYIGTRQQSHRSSHVVPNRIFDDVEERERVRREKEVVASRNNHLMSETTTS